MVKMIPATQYKIYRQLSDEFMTSKGYKLHIDENQSENVYWQKSLKVDDSSEDMYSIEIKEIVTDEGFYSIKPSISFEHMDVELQSLIDIDIDFIEDLSKDLCKAFVKHFWS
jgi:hypothetical protein